MFTACKSYVKAAINICSIYLLSKLLQHSQNSTCHGVLIYAYKFTKKMTLMYVVSYEFCEISKRNTFFTLALLYDCSSWKFYPSHTNVIIYFNASEICKITENLEKRQKLLWEDFSNCRSSHSQMIFKIGVLENFTKLTGKHLCWSFFLIKLQAATLLKRDFSTDVFLRILENFQEQLLSRTPLCECFRNCRLFRSALAL